MPIWGVDVNNSFLLRRFDGRVKKRELFAGAAGGSLRQEEGKDDDSGGF